MRLRFSLLILVAFFSCLLPALAARQARADGVVQWERCDAGLPVGDGTGVRELSAGGDGQALYAIVQGEGIFKSTDKAKTWTKLNGDAPVLTNPYSITASPDDAKLIYASAADAGQGLWRSTDGGATWTQFTAEKSGLASDDIEKVAFCPGDPKVIVVGHRDGNQLSVSTDGGTSWNAVKFSKTPVKNQYPVVMGDQHWAIVVRQEPMQGTSRICLVTSDGGKTWVQGTGDVEYFTGRLPIVNVGQTLITNRHHGMNFSLDGGKTWSFHMGTHTRVIGTVGQIIFREGDRTTIRGTDDRILNLELSEDFGAHFRPANGNLLSIMSEADRKLVTIPIKTDAYAHIRVASAWAGAGHDVYLGLGKAGLYHGLLLWSVSGPRLAGGSIAPSAAPEGEAGDKFVVSAYASARWSPIKRVYALLDCVELPELQLYDDGQHDDGAAGDKLYGNNFILPKDIPAGEKIGTIVAEDEKGNISSTAIRLNIVSADTKLMVWDGQRFTGGLSFVSPRKPLNSFHTQTEVVRPGKKVALEFHGEGGGYIGGGWNWHGWYPDDAGEDIHNFRNLSFWMKYELYSGDKTATVSVGLGTNDKGTTSMADVGDYCKDYADGQWHLIEIPLADLYAPKAGSHPPSRRSKVWQLDLSSWAPRDRSFSVFIDDIGFDYRPVRAHSQWVSLPEPRAASPLPASAPQVSADVDIKSAGIPISPYIYGVAMGDPKVCNEMGVTIRRAGGNQVSPLNWKRGFSNKGSDWFFTNTGTETPPQDNWLVKFPAVDKQAGLETYLTIPLMGRVAKDGTSCGYDIRKYPDQTDWAGKEQPSDPHPYAGNGIQYVRGANGQIEKGRNGNPVTKLVNADPNDCSVEMTPQEQTDVFRYMVQTMGYGTADKGGIKFLALDNEPCLWHATHRPMHPAGVSYDELWQRTVTAAAMLKKIDPTVKIAGPASWGWTAYYYSGKDAQDCDNHVNGATWDRPPDYATHGSVPLAKWYMKKLAEYKKQTGVSLVDILDFHFYPQTGIYMSGKPNDPATMEARVQETRVLWDPTWKDPSWMGKEAPAPHVIQLIGMMKRWIAECNPGMEVALGEYNFGGEGDVSGGVAQAELLGVFAREGVSYAFYWFSPPVNSSPYFAFKMFRDPDGKHTAFGDRYLPSTVSAPDDVSVHAARDSRTGRLTFILINKRAAKPARLTLSLSAPVREQDTTIYEYSDADSYCIGALPVEHIAGSKILLDLPPMSVERFDLMP